MLAQITLKLLGAAPGGDPETARAAGSVAPQEHGPYEVQASPLDPDIMMRKVLDARYLDLGFTRIDLSPLSVPPFQVAGLEVDLSITKHVVFLFLSAVLTVLTMWLAARQARRMEAGEARAPGGLLNGVEAFFLYLRDEVAMRNVGHGGERFVPLVITLFFFILYANLLGLVPFGSTATTNIMVTGGLAFISLVVIEFAGYRALGLRGYLGTIFYAPPGLNPVMKTIMLVIMTPVELLGKIAKPFALAIRLFANMTAGSFVLLAILGLILLYGGFTHTAGWMAIFGPLMLGLFLMFLKIFVCFLQAYIFALLTAVFIGLIRAH